MTKIISKKIGYIGLGKMGFNMANRLLTKGWKVVATDVNDDAVDRFIEVGGVGYKDLKDLVNNSGDPGERVIWLMVPHNYVDGVLDDLGLLLSFGDIVIDGGNSLYELSIERSKKMSKKGIKYIDAGVSGGPEGAKNGVCVMVGGEKDTYNYLEDLFKDISAKDAYKYMGRSGAGHFVKMVHNGIEYGMMEAIAEGFNIMKHSDFDLKMLDVADIYQHQSVITSRLVGWLQKGFQTYGEDLAEVSGSAGASGEGEWTLKVAGNMGIDAGVIQHALDARIESQKDPSYAGKLIQTMRNMFGGHAGNTKVSS